MTVFHICPVDQRPCEVLALSQGFPEEMEVFEAVEDLWALLPCQRCREGEKTVQSLLGTRLGRHERRILLEAPSNVEKPVHLEPEADTRSAEEALLRAMRKLEASGLVERTWVGGKKYEPQSKMAVRRTVPGDWVVSLIKHPLLTGAAIRWGKYLEEMRKRVRKDSPEVLAKEFRRELEAVRVRGQIEKEVSPTPSLPPPVGRKRERNRPLQSSLFPEWEEG